MRASTLRSVAALTLASLPLSLPTRATDHGGEDRLSPRAMAQLGDARRATAPFHEINVALGAGGYAAQPVQDLAGNTCIDQPGEGAMGIHYVKPAVLFDGEVDALQPVALIAMGRRTTAVCGWSAPSTSSSRPTGTRVIRAESPSCSARSSTSWDGEPLWAVAVLCAARLDVAAEPQRPVQRLEPGGALPLTRARGHVHDMHMLFAYDASVELKTARLTLLIDPAKKAAFEALCAAQDLTPSQVVRQLIRDYLALHGASYQPSGKAAPPRPAAPRKAR